jgi:phospholipid/cholesterol/gamma-HCH transport system ATP-binding protein
MRSCFNLQPKRLGLMFQGQVVWEGPTTEFDKSEEAIVQQFSQGSLEGPIKYL